MAIEFVRIDDRLIHGQVATTWLRMHEIEQVIIVSDEVVKDKTRQTIVSFAAPKDVKVVFFGVQKFSEIFNNNPIKRRTMLLYTNPIDIKDNLLDGVKIPYLNVGQIGKTEEREVISSGVAISQDEKIALKEIDEMGIKVEVQMVPNDSIKNIKELI